MSEPTTLRASTPDDMFTLVPYLLGFHPGESLVAVQVEGTRVGAVARADLTLRPGDLVLALEPLFRQVDSRFVLIAYSRERLSGLEALRAVEARLGPERVIDSLLTDGVRGWSLFSEDDAGWVLPPPDIELCAEAVFAGMAPLADRAAVVRLCAGPGRGHIRRCSREYKEALTAVRADPAGREHLLDRLLDAGLADPDALSGQDLAQLAALASEIGLRDQAWMRMTRLDAEAHRELWQRVVQITPDRWAVPVLCLLGMASWLAGEGALLVACLERGHRLDPSYSMLGLLDELNRNAVPPTLWDSMDLSDEADPAR